MTPSDQRIRRRFTACSRKHIRVKVQRNRTESPYTGTVVDLSVDGARIALPSPVAVGEQVDIDLSVSALRISEQRQGTVCWTALTRDLLWHTGLHFEEPLDDVTISALAAAAYIERRQSDRVKVSIPATARPEASCRQISVRIADISSDGLGLVSPEPLDVDRRVMILIDDPVQPRTVLTHIRSCKQSRHGHLIGCEFVTPVVNRPVLDHSLGNRISVPESRWCGLRNCAGRTASVIVCLTVMTQWDAAHDTVDPVETARASAEFEVDRAVPLPVQSALHSSWQ